MAIFFTSDWHLGHRNIIRYCQRPFASVEEMDDAIIANTNALVQSDDMLYHLGDWSFGMRGKSFAGAAEAYRSRVQCKNIVLIWGNHDRRGRGDARFQRLFQSTHDLLELTLGEQFIVLCHYAMRVWNHSHHGSYHLYGHSHGSLPDDLHARSFDCGVDCFDFKPISLEQVTAIMQAKQWQPVNHHGREEPTDSSE